MKLIERNVLSTACYEEAETINSLGPGSKLYAKTHSLGLLANGKGD